MCEGYTNQHKHQDFIVWLNEYIAQMEVEVNEDKLDESLYCKDSCGSYMQGYEHGINQGALDVLNTIKLMF